MRTECREDAGGTEKECGQLSVASLNELWRHQKLWHEGNDYSTQQYHWMLSQ